MKKAVQSRPDGYHTITPYLIVRGAARAIEYYVRVFGAEEQMRMADPGSGSIGHAEIRIGDSLIMLADEHPDMGYVSPQTLGGSATSLMIYVDDVDAVYRRAVEAGGAATRPVEDKFYGDRAGQLTDPFGHVWTIATHTEDLSLEEIERRAAKLFGGG